MPMDIEILLGKLGLELLEFLKLAGKVVKLVILLGLILRLLVIPLVVHDVGSA